LCGKVPRSSVTGTNYFFQTYLKMTKTHPESGYVPTYLLGFDVCPNTTIEKLTENFLKDAKLRFDNRDYNHYNVAMRLVCQLHGSTKTSQFGTKALIEVQKHFVKQGYSRNYCNKLVNYVRSVFRWGAINELVPKSTPYILKLISPLLAGKTTAPESPPRQDVPDDVVDATLPHLLPTVAAMVRVQRAAVMRPSEVCRMKVGDIDTKMIFGFISLESIRGLGEDILVLLRLENWSRRLLLRDLLGNNRITRFFRQRTQ
jgi:integrase